MSITRIEGYGGINTLFDSTKRDLFVDDGSSRQQAWKGGVVFHSFDKPQDCENCQVAGFSGSECRAPIYKRQTELAVMAGASSLLVAGLQARQIAEAERAGCTTAILFI